MNHTSTQYRERSAFGYCQRCQTVHSLPTGQAFQACQQLMAELQLGRIANGDDTDFLTTPLFGEARGKMFGILECLNQENTKVFLKAFSGQYNGLWVADGWVPPIFSPEKFVAVTVETEREIKKMGAELAKLPKDCEPARNLRRQRRDLSRQLMEDIHDLYLLTNFRGEKRALKEVFQGKGIPSGTGDCCAPKLLQQAALLGLKPLGIAEFFWGRPTISGSYSHEQFSVSCAEKCQPILGFMLCGLTDP